jgi:hypothetical protein
LSQVTLALLIHSHQPVGNFDHVIEDAYQKSYAPFLETLARHPRIRVSLHYSGILLGWLEQRHPEFFERLRQLAARGQVELVGGGYYEPILPVIPDRDKQLQLGKLSDYIAKHFGRAPRGAWVAERVWEPGLVRPLHEGGVEYIVLDDTHFLAAGLEPSELYTSYITEETGAPLRLIPSVKSLRYTIPFQDPAETLRVLEQGKGRSGALFAMGDDCEKFGVWPGTYDHCYTNGWLERFLKVLEDEKSWVTTATLSDFLDAHPPSGRIYLPTASYAEMMEWALPTAASSEFKLCLEEAERVPCGGRFQRFLRGGIWQNFLSKYAESNQIHKLMLEVSRRLEEAEAKPPKQQKDRHLLDEARTHLLAAQCNDAYWHGVFGGLYAPHLRSAVLRNLVEAESLLDRTEVSAKNPGPHVETRDYDVDGQPEVLIRHPAFGIVARPADGGTVSSLRFKPANAELVNSLMRRPEPYHELVRQKAITRQAPREGPASIHDHVWTREPNMAALLRYDRYARHAFRTYLFPAARRCEDFDYFHLDENGDLARGLWKVAPDSSPPGTLELWREALHRVNGGDVCLRARKILTTGATGSTWQLTCRSSLSMNRTSATPLAHGIEMVFNLLAPDAPDRYFLAQGVRRPLEFRGEIDSPQLVLVDEWQRVQISLGAEPAPRWWIVPIETISQSETGFERVYQGSAILAMWKPDPPLWREITSTLQVEISLLGAGSDEQKG